MIFLTHANPTTRANPAKLEERQWRRFFNDPSLWWDCRTTKKDSKLPDLVHVCSGDGLWLDSCFCPRWVRDKFQATDNLSLLTAKRPSKIRSKQSISHLLTQLKACRASKDLQTGRRVHANVVNSGNNSNIFLANALIDMYAKCGEIDSAREVFDKMEERTIVSWNTIILGYASNGQGHTGLDLFQLMHEQGFVPNTRTFVAALKSCSRVEDLDLARSKAVEIHSQVSKAGLSMDIYVTNMLVSLYAKLGLVNEAREVFDRAQLRSILMWNGLMVAYARNGEAPVALELFHRMQEEGFVPDAWTFVTALEACMALAAKPGSSKIVSVERGMRIHRLAANAGHDKDLFVANSLVAMYSRSGSMEDARRVFERMERRDVVSWNVIIQASVQSGDGKLALELFQRMHGEDGEAILPDTRTYTAALKACSTESLKETEKQFEFTKMVSLEKGFAIHAEISRRAAATGESLIMIDSFLANSLVDMYAKSGSLFDARRVFDAGRQTLASWNALILGYAHCGDGQEALRLLTRMQGEEVFTPDAATYVAGLKAAASLASLTDGRRLHEDILKLKLLDKEDTILATALVDFYGKCGSMEEAEEVFEGIRDKDSVAWSTLLAGYSQRGDFDRVFDRFEKMRKARVKVDGIAFLHVLTVCSHAGMVEKGKEYFRVMCEEDGVVARLEHWTCMVDMLARANRLEEAVEMVERMPYEADLTVWTSILCACRKWGNVEVGKVAFDAILRMGGKEVPGTYALMASTYSSLDRE